MDDVITISRAEYDRLRESAEELADIRTYDEAMANRRESIPADVVNRILDGEHPITAFRNWRGLAVAELSRRSGVNRIQILDIESGRRRGSVDTLRRIADTLGV